MKISPGAEFTPLNPDSTYPKGRSNGIVNGEKDMKNNDTKASRSTSFTQSFIENKKEHVYQDNTGTRLPRPPCAFPRHPSASSVGGING